MNTGLVSGQERQSLVRFDLSAIPAGATINSAIFSAYNVNTAQSDIRLHRVTAPWSESLVTWQSFNGAFAPVQDAIFSNSLNPSSAPIVPLVQSWVSGANPNHGFLLRQPLFGTANTQFKSSEHATVAQRPRLDVCFTVTCAAGFADCNNNGADGCETAINTLTNCGACGTTCATPNAAATCATGTCAISACNAGFGNCDGKASNGCETSLTTATSCGACGTACSLANGASSCANGTCTLLGCSAGFFDCDGNTQNGCEALPCDNGQHCQRGMDCSSGVCQNGICAAPTCTDGVQNGGESDVDCGGSCALCGITQLCGKSSDCTTGVCVNGHCQAATCSYGVQNGNETGVDCGGACFVAEVCDGKDNDCNGSIDNGNPGGGLGCSTGKQGTCAAGTTACTAGGAGVLACNRNTGPTTESCDGLDNDCNGSLDNGAVQDSSGGACTSVSAANLGNGGAQDISGNVPNAGGSDVFAVNFTNTGMPNTYRARRAECSPRQRPAFRRRRPPARTPRPRLTMSAG